MPVQNIFERIFCQTNLLYRYTLQGLGIFISVSTGSLTETRFPTKLLVSSECSSNSNNLHKGEKDADPVPKTINYFPRIAALASIWADLLRYPVRAFRI